MRPLQAARWEQGVLLDHRERALSEAIHAAFDLD